MLITLIIFHFEISGNDFNDEHSSNIPSILLIFFKFQFDISGNYFKEEQFENK